MKDIISVDNAAVRHIRQLAHKKYRQEYGEFIAEGARSICTLLESGFEVVSVVYARSYAAKGRLLGHANELCVPDALFDKLCDTGSPQGVLAVVRQRFADFSPTGTLYVYCDHIADPGNLGTIARTADAFGFDGILLSPGCADVYAPKTVRATMGSIAYVPLFQSGIEQLAALRSAGFGVTASALSAGAQSLYEMEFRGKHVLVVGSEANGASEEVLRLCDSMVTIPMYGGAESLNAAVAAAVLMYEMKKQHHVGAGA